MKMFFIGKNGKFLNCATGGLGEQLEDALYYNRVGPARSAASWQLNNKGIQLDIYEYEFNIKDLKILDETARLEKQKAKKVRRDEWVKEQNRQEEIKRIQDRMSADQLRLQKL